MESPNALITLPGRGIKRELYSRVFQSPLAGVSDQVFRNLVRQWAPEALLFTEMVNANSLEIGYGRYKIEELSKESGPIGVQLFDYRPKAMVEAAIRAETSGAFLIDINMGCPVKKIAGKGGGSGLLKNAELAMKIVKEVVKAVTIPVTVKTRLGWCHDSCDPVGFSLKLQDAGAQLITIHGRTRQQGFSGKADWVAISKVKKALNIPVIANGDINNAKDALNCLAITNADGVMIGRGSMGSPWLVGQIDYALKGKETFKTPCREQRLLIALAQLKELIHRKGNHGLLIARKHMSWTCKGFEGAAKLRYELVRAETPSQAICLLEREIQSTSKNP